MTTPDPATLREALADLRFIVHTDYDGSWELSEDGERVVAAARWALDLIEGGTVEIEHGDCRLCADEAPVPHTPDLRGSRQRFVSKWQEVAL